MAVLTMAVLTMAILTMAILTMTTGAARARWGQGLGRGAAHLRCGGGALERLREPLRLDGLESKRGH